MASVVGWTSSKIAAALAALVLVVSVISFVLALRDTARRDALQAIADRAAAHLEEVSRAPGEVATSMSLGTGGTLELPRLADGKPYSLTLYRAYVVASFNGERAFSVLRTPLHLWEPRAGNYTASEVEGLDTLHPSLTLESGGTAIVSRRSLTIDGGATMKTFAFL